MAKKNESHYRGHRNNTHGYTPAFRTLLNDGIGPYT
ncbi:hypothetical protein OKW29_001933 [Paraburkholderia sp. CI3]